MRPTALLRQAALAATILTAGSGCDKPSTAASTATTPAPGGGGRGGTASPAPSGAPAPRAVVLYQIFGGRGDPRMRPVAALVGGRVQPLALTAAAWQRFDSLHHRPGAALTVYQGGRPAGRARITRPMWNRTDGPLYTLPHCRHPTPLAAVRLEMPRPTGLIVEHLATSAPLRRGGATPRHASTGREADPLAHARAVAARVAQAAGARDARPSGLDLRVGSVAAGVGAHPTLVISSTDPSASEERGLAHLFVVAERGPDGYAPAYERVVRHGDAAGEYRRYVDHLDVTGDGVDELLLEGWSSGRESYLVVLQHRDGAWVEIFRGSENWCTD